MAEPTTKGAAGLAWRSAIQAAVRGPAVFLLAASLLLAIDIAAGGSVRPSTHIPYSPTSEFVAGFASRAARIVAESLVLAVAAVSVHRFILLDEVPRIGTLRLRRLAVFGLAFAFFQIVSLVFSVLMPLMPLAVLVVHLAVIVVSVRFALMFPGIAVDNPAPVTASWTRSRGQFGEIVAAFVLAMLPLVAVVIVPFTVIGPLWAHPGRSLAAIGYDAVWDVVKVISTAVGAGVASWIYRGAPALTQPQP